MTGERNASRTRPTDNLLAQRIFCETATGRRLHVTVFSFLVFLFVLFLFFDRFQFEGIDSYDFEGGATLRARDHFTLIDLIFSDVEVALTFGTIHHESLRISAYPDNI